MVLFLGGILGEEPPADDAGVMAFAESLPGREIRDFLRTAEPLDDPDLGAAFLRVSNMLAGPAHLLTPGWAPGSAASARS